MRDGGQCTFRDHHVRRCPARKRLEFHHVLPFARGGDHREGNVTLRCSGHNAFQVVGVGFWITSGHIREWNERLHEIERSAASLGGAASDRPGPEPGRAQQM